MFRKGFETASGFTFPVLISRKPIQGDCTGGIGTFFMVNDEGWFLTAAHVMELIKKLDAEAIAVADHKSRERAIRGDTGTDQKERGKRLKALGKLDDTHTEKASVLWNDIGTDVAQHYIVPGIDLCVGQFSNFDPTKVGGYPQFRNPAHGFPQGTAICKLGFPFFDARPTWDSQASNFVYPSGSLPPVIFPLEGMLTRVTDIQLADEHGNIVQYPLPLKRLETSSPGLKGQSGGPMFDVEGTVWALQSLTTHASLGFEPHAQHQFMNMGVGPSAETIVAVLNDLSVKHQLAP